MKNSLRLGPLLFVLTLLFAGAFVAKSSVIASRNARQGTIGFHIGPVRVFPMHWTDCYMARPCAMMFFGNS